MTLSDLNLRYSFLHIKKKIDRDVFRYIFKHALLNRKRTIDLVSQIKGYLRSFFL